MTARAPHRGPCGRRCEPGFATLVFPMLLWVATLVGVVTVDLGAYLVAAARAQQLADAAALAAVAADLPASTGRGPSAQASRVATSGGGQLERCRCTAGRGSATVRISVAVPGLVIPRLGAGRVTAEARAVLAPP